MNLILEFRQLIKVRWQAFTSFIDVDVYSSTDDLDGKLVIVMKDPNDENSGLSVTNGVDEFAYAIAKKLGLAGDKLKAITWIEHYPEREGPRKGLREKSTYDVVTFNRMDGSPYEMQFWEPDWRYLGEDQFKELIGGTPVRQ